MSKFVVSCRRFLRSVVAAALAVVAGCACTPVAADPWDGSTPKAEVCQVWARNAMYGASQRLRGARPVPVWITKDVLIGMIEHGLGSDRLYFLDSEEYDAADRAFLLESVLYGYGAMDTSIKADPDATHDPVQWHARFVEACMSREGI
jgi:hypothetical protein